MVNLNDLLAKPRVSTPPVMGVDKGESGLPTFKGSIYSLEAKPRAPENKIDYAAAIDKGRGFTHSDIRNDPLKMDHIRKYMIFRKGDDYNNKSDEETLDDFLTHMRWFEANEINTLGEARQAFELEDKDKHIFKNAYEVYESIGSLDYASDSPWSDAFDYVKATAASPSTYAGFLVGKLVSKIATRGLQKGVSKAVQKEVAESTAKNVGKMASKAGAASRKEAVATALLATAWDGAVAAAQESTYQKTLMRVGARDEFDYMAMVLATTLGTVGGVVSYFPEAMRGTVRLKDVDVKVSKAREARSKAAGNRVSKDMKKTLNRLSTDWIAIAQKGMDQDVDLAKRQAAVKWFFDINEEDSFIRVLHKAGADLSNKGDGSSFSHRMIEFARGLPKENVEEFNQILKPTGSTFGNLMEILAGTMREAGQEFNAASVASKFYDNFRDITVTKNKAVRAVMEEADPEKRIKGTAKEIPSDVISYTGNLWKKLLVSHLGTTILNVKGWAMAAGMRGLAEIIHGGTLGSIGYAQKLMGSASADASIRKSKALINSQGFLVRQLIDPFTSVKAFSDLIELAPRKYKKEGLSTFFGGVADEGPEKFGINPRNLAVRGAESYADMAARLSLIKAQDVYTKSFSGLKSLDQSTRTAFGKGIEDLLSANETHLITDEMWDKAVKSLLEDTFSVDYTRGHSPANKLAKAFETVSNTPFINFVVPFGRFVTNTVGFMIQYSPFAVIRPLKAFKEGDLGERFAKAVVGTSMFYFATKREEEKQKEGLQWYEERTSSGEVQNVQGLFPVSIYNLVGRIVSNGLNGNGVPLDLIKELEKQIGPLASLQDFLGNTPFTDMVRQLIKVPEEEAGITWEDVIVSVGTFMGGSLGNVGAGFLRPFDFPNDLMGSILDIEGHVDQAAVDKKQAEGGEKLILNFGRYVDTVFNLMLGEDTGHGKLYGEAKNSSTEKDRVKDPNPISRIFGTPLQPKRDSIDILLGMVDKPSFKADEFTTGLPEYDNMINDLIFGTLERKSEALLESKFFSESSMPRKRAMVDKMLQESKKEVLEAIELGYLGEPEDALLNEKRKFLKLPQVYRAEAKKYLGIEAEDKDLTMEQIEVLTSWIKINRELDNTFIEHK